MAFQPSDHPSGDRDCADGAQLITSLLLYFIPVYRWLNITFCLFLILSKSYDPQSIKSVLCFSYLQACIRSKGENKVSLSTRFVAELGTGSVSRTGALVTAVQRGEGIAGPGDSSFLSVPKKNPQPQPELLPLSTAAAGTAGPVHIWWQVLLVTEQSIFNVFLSHSQK